MLAYHTEEDEELSRWYWETLTWAAFFLWVNVLLQLRSFELFSGPIRMVQMSFQSMLSYMVVVVCGVLCFTNVFQSVRQIIYQRVDDDSKISPPFERDMEVHTFWDWKDKWLGEYI